jgi:urease accessory protein
VAYGHVGREAGVGFVAGLLHPVFGLDHFLAMLSVGIVSAQLGGRWIFTVPATFVLSMIGGAVIGVRGYQWPLSEAGIAISVVVLGTAIATVKKDGNGWPVLAVVVLFGSLHGHAHGLELPRAVDPVYYAAGFVTSTTAIHLLGVGIGHLLTARVTRLTFLRHMGSAMAGMGLMILLNSMASR